MRKTLYFVTLVAGVIGMAHCSGDDNNGGPASDSGTIESGTDAKATGVGGNKVGTGGSADSGNVNLDGSQAGTAQGTGGTAVPTDGQVGTGGSVIDAASDVRTDAPACPNNPVGQCNNFAVNAVCGARQCVCTATDTGRVWQCPAIDGGNPDTGVTCPAAAQVTDGADCQGLAGATCTGTGVSTPCRCRNFDQKWWCVDDAYLGDTACPTKLPSNDEACLAPMTCAGAGGKTCTCPTPTTAGPRYVRWVCSSEAGSDAQPEASPPDATIDVAPEMDATADVEIDSPVDAAEQ